MRAPSLIAAALASASLISGQTSAFRDYVCPLDPDVREAAPGKCPRCGAELLFRVLAPVAYPMKLALTPRTPRPGDRVEMAFSVNDPNTGRPVKRFEPVDQEQLHLFIVSQDLGFFAHECPAPSADGSFHYQSSLPKSGMYRLLASYYPAGATPQLTLKTILLAGAPAEVPELTSDLAPKRVADLEVTLVAEPAKPMVRQPATLRFRVTPSADLEPFLGAAGHLLAASSDLIDLIHVRSDSASDRGEIRFHVTFPRARTYRLWVQFQRRGVVNAAAFTLPVTVVR
jgi:hypothetical protein